MKNYILFALLSILSTGSTFGTDTISLEINHPITENLGATKIQTEQEKTLQKALKDIVEFAQANDAQGKIAINHLKKIKEALNLAKKHPATQSSISEAYKTFAIAANRTMYIAIGSVIGAAATCVCILTIINKSIDGSV